MIQLKKKEEKEPRVSYAFILFENIVSKKNAFECFDIFVIDEAFQGYNLNGAMFCFNIFIVQK